jgi:hypothetical protein
MTKKLKRGDILSAFAVEPAHDLATFNRYVADYPQYARTLRVLWRSIVVGEAKEDAKARRRAAHAKQEGGETFNAKS